MQKTSRPPPLPPYLLQEGHEAARAVLVGAREVDVLEVEDEAVALARPEDAARRRRLEDAQLPDLLDDVLSGRLSGAVQRRRGRRSARVDEMADEHRLARTLWPHEEERLHAFKPRSEERSRALQAWRAGSMGQFV